MTWSPVLQQWMLLSASVILFVIAESLSAHWGKTGNTLSIVIMCLLAPSAYFFFGWLNKTMTLTVSSALNNMLIVAGCTLFGYFYFKEVLTVKQYMGLGLSLVSIYLLNAK